MLFSMHCLAIKPKLVREVARVPETFRKNYEKKINKKVYLQKKN